MKKTALFIFTAIVALISFSCDDNFEPKSNFKEQYILNCIINANSSVQIATLAKSYDVNGYDPKTNTTDPAIAGADIKLIHKGVTYSFSDSTVVRTDSSRYKGPREIYVVRGLKFKANDSVKIVATLNNGVVLSSAIKIPPTFSFTTSHYDIDPEEIAKQGNLWSISWVSQDKAIFFAPQFNLTYKKYSGSTYKVYNEKIPLTYYLNNNNKYTPEYLPSVSTSTGFSYDMASFDSVLTNISMNDPDKDNYDVLYCSFSMLALNETLAAYYSTSNGYLDNVTIRLDEGDYTNINGGLGIFGAYILSATNVMLETDYVN